MADGDDLLSPDEIEALIQASQSDAQSGSAPASPGPSSGSSQLLNQSDLESLMQAKAPAAPSPTKARTDSAVDRVLQQTENQLAAALATAPPKGLPSELGSPASFNYPNLGSIGPRSAENLPLASLQDVELDLRIELGRTELLIEEVLKLREGSVVPLDKLAGDPVDILVNGQLIARGEVLVLNDNFCVRVAEILTPDG